MSQISDGEAFYKNHWTFCVFCDQLCSVQTMLIKCLYSGTYVKNVRKTAMRSEALLVIMLSVFLFAALRTDMIEICLWLDVISSVKPLWPDLTVRRLVEFDYSPYILYINKRNSFVLSVWWCKVLLLFICSFSEWD